MAKKKPAKTTNKKAPTKIKRNEYLIGIENLDNKKMILTPEEAIQEAKDILSGSNCKTVLIYQLVRKVTTNNEPAVVEVN